MANEKNGNKPPFIYLKIDEGESLDSAEPSAQKKSEDKPKSRPKDKKPEQRSSQPDDETAALNANGQSQGAQAPHGGQVPTAAQGGQLVPSQYAYQQSQFRQLIESGQFGPVGYMPNPMQFDGRQHMAQMPSMNVPNMNMSNAQTPNMRTPQGAMPQGVQIPNYAYRQHETGRVQEPLAGGAMAPDTGVSSQVPTSEEEIIDITPFVIPVFTKKKVKEDDASHQVQEQLHGQQGQTPQNQPDPDMRLQQQAWQQAQVQQQPIQQHAQQQNLQHPFSQQQVGRQLQQPQQPQQVGQRPKQAQQPTQSQQAQQPVQQHQMNQQAQFQQMGQQQTHAKQSRQQDAMQVQQQHAMQDMNLHQQKQGNQQPWSFQANQPTDGFRPVGDARQSVQQGQPTLTGAANAAQAAAFPSEVHNSPSQAAVQQTVSRWGNQPHNATPTGGMNNTRKPASAASRQAQAPSVGNAPAAYAAPNAASLKNPSITAPSTPPNNSFAGNAPSGDIGKPLLDEKAIKESPMFDKPPVSIEDGMRNLERGRSKRKRLLIIALIVLVLAAIGVAAYFFLSQQGVASKPDVISQTTSVQGSNASSSSSSSASASSSQSAAASAGETAPSDDHSGSVVYQYSANTASGVKYQVEETVTFQYNGDCESSTMSMTFPDEASAKAFTDNLARDYGASFKLESLNGVNAVVVIDNSGLHLNRDEYENALRYSVSDLVVVEK